MRLTRGATWEMQRSVVSGFEWPSRRWITVEGSLVRSRYCPFSGGRTSLIESQRRATTSGAGSSTPGGRLGARRFPRRRSPHLRGRESGTGGCRTRHDRTRRRRPSPGGPSGGPAARAADDARRLSSLTQQLGPVGSPRGGGTRRGRRGRTRWAAGALSAWGPRWAPGQSLGRLVDGARLADRECGMRPSSRSPPAGPQRPSGRRPPCADCGRSSGALVRGMCVFCRGRQEECLRRAHACLEPGPLAQGRTGQPEPGPDLAACELCAAPIVRGHYCAGCQRLVSAAVSAYERQAQPRRRR